MLEKLEIRGYVGGDAVTEEKNGVKYTRFNVAVSQKFTKPDGTKSEITNWYGVFKKPNNLDSFLKKGSQVYVRGNPHYSVNNYEGVNSVRIKLSTNEIDLISSPKEVVDNIATENVENSQNNATVPLNSSQSNFDGIPPDLSNDNIPPVNDDLSF